MAIQLSLNKMEPSLFVGKRPRKFFYGRRLVHSSANHRRRSANHMESGS
jgi:hypothetical protein